VGHHEGGRHALGIECGVDRGLHLCQINRRIGCFRRQPIAHWPRRGVGGRQRALDDRRFEEDVRLTDRQRDATLAAHLFGGALGAIRHRHGDGALLAIDHRRAELGALVVRRDEVADVLAGKCGIETGDEHRRAHDLRVAGCVMFDGFARRRHIRRLQLERLGPVEQRLARVGRRLCRERR
jgi:hypothetical protein